MYMMKLKNRDIWSLDIPDPIRCLPGEHFDLEDSVCCPYCGHALFIKGISDSYDYCEHVKFVYVDDGCDYFDRVTDEVLGWFVKQKFNDKSELSINYLYFCPHIENIVVQKRHACIYWGVSHQ